MLNLSTEESEPKHSLHSKNLIDLNDFLLEVVELIFTISWSNFKFSLKY